jgi:hypothetical protein
MEASMLRIIVMACAAAWLLAAQTANAGPITRDLINPNPFAYQWLIQHGAILGPGPDNHVLTNPDGPLGPWIVRATINGADGAGLVADTLSIRVDSDHNFAPHGPPELVLPQPGLFVTIAVPPPLFHQGWNFTSSGVVSTLHANSISHQDSLFADLLFFVAPGNLEILAYDLRIVGRHCQGSLCPATPTVPEPSTILLLATGLLAAIAGSTRKARG